MLIEVYVGYKCHSVLEKKFGPIMQTKLTLTTQVNFVSVELMGVATRPEGASHGVAVGVITANTLLPTEVPPFCRATTWTLYQVKGTRESTVATVMA